jgi:hypothetical protein
MYEKFIVLPKFRKFTPGYMLFVFYHEMATY